MGRILVVDDDRAMQETLADALRSAGYEVDTCRDGRKVIEELEARTHDLMVLDVLIPHLNGFKVLEALRAHPTLAGLPVVMISGIYRSRNHRGDMLERFGVVDYLDKPFSTHDLRDLVVRTIGAGSPSSDPVDEPVPLTRKKPTSESEIDQRLVEPEAQTERSEVERVSRSRFKTSAFLLQGSIRRNPVAAILGRLWFQRASGGLLLRQGKVKKIIYVEAGNAYAVQSNKVSECLGRVLVGERLISEEECAASIERMKTTGRKQGELLVEMRSMTEKNLKFALELQLEKKLFDTFRWEDGEFRFNSSIELPEAGAKLEWQGAGVVLEGIRRAFDETRLRGLMLPILDVPLGLADPGIDFDGLGLTATERKAVAAMALPATGRALLETMDVSPADALRILYGLIALSLVVPSPS